MQEKFYENLRNPARARRAGAMRWFPTNIGIHPKKGINTQRVLNELETQLLMYGTTREFLGHPWSFVR
jgi:hypothetical protein